MATWRESTKFSFFILCFGAFVDWVSYGLVYPIFAVTLFQHDPIFHDVTSNVMRGFWLGVLLAASPLGQFFTSPFIGMLSDRYGRKPVLQVTYLIILVGYFFSAVGIWAHSLFLLILGRVITGIGAGNIAVINSAVADISQPASKAKNFALVTMASGIGFAVGPVIGGKLSVWGFGVPFVFAGLLTFVGFFLFTFFFRETFSKNKESLISLHTRLKNLLNLAYFGKFRILFPAFFLFCFGWSFYWEFIPVTWIKIYSLKVQQIGNFYAYGSAFYVLSSGLLIRPIVKKFKAIPILIAAWAMLGLCLFALIPLNVNFYWAGIPLQQFLVALIFPVGTTIVSNEVSGSRQGEVLGSFQSLQSLAFAATPFLGGALLDFSYHMPLIVSGIAMLLACLILFIGYRRHYVH